LERTHAHFTDRLYRRRATRGALLSAALIAASHLSLAEPPRVVGGHAFVPPSDQWLLRARDLDIARSRSWLRLLHYRSDGERRLVSEVDGQRFFLAPDGARDPEAELAATLIAFAQPVARGREDEHALCRFPARRRLLDQQLHFGSMLPAPACPALTRFESALDTESVSVVYVANFLSNPGSAFGHTFLRLRRHHPAGSTASSDALDHGVEYAAQTDTTNPLLYAFKGLTGFFPGVFRFHSFESKAHEYANVEARDLWEYDLRLSESEVELLTLHLWELSDTHLDYYYLTKNCSYHALATIEAAAPRIDLLAHLNLVVLPRDTIKALFTVPGLVRKLDYRPSLRSQFRAQASRLSAAQNAAVLNLLRRPNAPLPPGFSPREALAVLTTADLVLAARFSERPDAKLAQARALLLSRRARLSSTTATTPLAEPMTAPADKAPQRAHGSLRLTWGSGVTSQYQSSFSSLGVRLALHDLADPPDGEPELSQLQFLDTRFRYDLGQRSFTLDRLTFAELVALNPVTRYERALSWRIRAFGMRLKDAGCPDCFAHGLDFSLGATLASEDERLAVFVMADVSAAFSARLDGIGGRFARVGLGPLAGVRARLSSQTIGLVTATWSYLPGARLKSTYDVRATLRGALAKNVAVGFEAAAQPLSVEGMLASYLYF
jgi:uncharacterized protein DUF4105